LPVNFGSITVSC